MIEEQLATIVTLLDEIKGALLAKPAAPAPVVAAYEEKPAQMEVDKTAEKAHRKEVIACLDAAGIKFNPKLSTKALDELLTKVQIDAQAKAAAKPVEEPTPTPDNALSLFGEPEVAKQVTLDSARTALKNYAAQTSVDEAKKLLALFNVQKISDLNPKQLEALVNKINAPAKDDILG